ncbi:uncharacterized protein LOC116146617 [Pistacia vera]|uniref:uncharacterized protein LOC116146617 n=1 Tax=Pistacia vera TaxID=55513 RepID=UPI001263D373|nr:uncharacterized protein LOC116146617 [Pistacia vera]
MVTNAMEKLMRSFLWSGSELIKDGDKGGGDRFVGQGFSNWKKKEKLNIHIGDYNAVAFKNAPDNLKLTSPEIQKDIVSAALNEIVNAIIRDFIDSLFATMIDESRDFSRKEQMIIVLHYVNKNELVVERFLGVEQVTSTTTLSLEATFDNFLSRHGLSFSRLRGQGYGEVSNMQGEFNSLKTLVLKENRCAYYIH